MKYNSNNLSKEYLTKCDYQVTKMFEYINDKTSGKKLTLATWIRKFVFSHPSYKKDSLVSKVKNIYQKIK